MSAKKKAITHDKPTTGKNILYAKNAQVPFSPIHQILYKEIDELYKSALNNGNREAVECLLYGASLIINRLNALADKANYKSVEKSNVIIGRELLPDEVNCKGFETVKQVAQNQYYWPQLLCTIENFDADSSSIVASKIMARLGALNAGKKLPYKSNVRTRASANLLIIHFNELFSIEINRLRNLKETWLPEFTKNNPSEITRLWEDAKNKTISYMLPCYKEVEEPSITPENRFKRLWEYIIEYCNIYPKEKYIIENEFIKYKSNKLWYRIRQKMRESYLQYIRNPKYITIRDYCQ